MNFSGLLKANFLGPQPGQGGTKMRWELTEALSFTFDKTPEAVELLNKFDFEDGVIKCTETEIVITAKAGTITDLASIPRPIWTFISPWDVARAAVIHDILYQRLRKVSVSEFKEPMRKLSDDIFEMGMKAAKPNVPSWKIVACYNSVRIFGRFVV